MTAPAKSEPGVQAVEYWGESFGIITVRYVWPEAPFLINRLRNMHYAVFAKLNAHWRDSFAKLAKDNPPMLSATVDVWHETATRRSCDVAACVPSFKAALDGIVDAGVLPDDSPSFVSQVTFHAPTFTGRDALVVQLVGPASSRP